MSAIFLRRQFAVKNLRRFLFHSAPHDFNYLRVVNIYMNLVSRHENLATVAHNYKSVENSNIRDTTESSHLNDSALKLVDKVLLDIDYSVRRTGRVARKHVEEVFSMIVDLGVPSSKTRSLYLLRSCGLMRTETPNERVQLADHVWKKLQDLGSQFDISHYNALLKVYVDNNKQFSPSEFLALVDSANIEPNKVTFLYLMQKYCNDGDLNGASAILEFMKEKGLPVSQDVFNSLITGHMKINDVSGAKDIFDVMRSSNLSPSAESYTALACGYAEKGDIDAIRSVLQDMQNSNIIPSPGNYLSIVASLSSDQHQTFVDEIIGLMEQNFDEWRQDVLNTVIDLINKDLFDTAFKLVLSVSTTENRSSYSTNIFLNHLIQSKKPLEKIMHYCEEINIKGLNDLAFLNCAKAAIDFKRFDLAVSIFKNMFQKGIPVRTHYFYDIFSFHRNSEEEILSTMRSMYELGVPADFKIYIQYVCPAISLKNPENILAKIQETGHTGAVDPLFQYYCYHGQIDHALFLTEKYPVAIPAEFDLKKYLAFSPSVVNGRHSRSFIKVLSYIMKNSGIGDKDSDVRRGTNLACLIQMNPSAFQFLLYNSDLEMYKRNNQCLEVCYRILKEKDPGLLSHLRKMENYQAKPRKSMMTVEEEEKELNLLKEKGLKTDIYLKQLLSFHIREKNIDRVNQLKTELDNLGVVCSPLLYVQLFNLYYQMNDIQMTADSLKTLKHHFPDFILDSVQILNYVSLLLKYSKFEEAIDVLKNECKELHMRGKTELLISTIRRIFDSAVEIGNFDLVKSIHSSLVHHAKSLNTPNIFFEPLIKMHFYRNDLDAAIDEFKNCVTHHQVTPCVHLLLKKCIADDDHIKLETVINIASTINGRHQVLHELIVAFFETGRITQAVKLIQNLGSKIDCAFLEDVCNRYYNQSRFSDLEEFIFIIKDVEHVDRGKLFFHLFKLYDHQNECKKALDLLHLLEKDMFSLDHKTKKLVANLLSRNNLEVPFATDSLSKEIADTNVLVEDIDEFYDCLERKDAIQALEKLQNMKKGLIRTLSLSDMTQIISILIEKKLVNDLSENVQAMSYIIENASDILRPLYERYSEAADTESMNQLANFLPDFVLKKSSFNKFMCQAYISGGKYEDLLWNLENRYNKKNKLFSLDAFEKLLQIPHLKERVINLAKKYLDVNFDLPITVVWAHHLINENYEAADEYHQLYSVSIDKIDSMILKAIRQKENLTMGEKYLEVIDNVKVRNRCKERAYGTVLDVLVLKEMYDKASDLMKRANDNNIDLGKHYRSTLITLKSALEREKKEVPFTIPSEEFIVSTGNFL